MARRPAGRYREAMPIRPLPTLLVNQIAAGEVIERPASVVKELVENAIDAGATRIDVVLEQGGTALVRVTDDGDGIPRDELPLAVAPHATSKIATAADLDAIATMGFRGEALASIASVSRFTIRSRTRDEDAAAILEGEGGTFAETRPASGAPGTSITVSAIFFNTPARRKFLKTTGTETSRCLDVVRRIALAHPDIGWNVTVDGRVRIDLPPGQSPERRAIAVLGAELEPELLPVGGEEGGVRVWGLAGTPDVARPTSRHQHLYLNGRAIQDRTVIHAVREAYRGLVDPGRHPTIVLFLEIDPAAVDVNVHPAKAEVRFRDQSVVHAAVRHTVRDALRAADLMPAVDLRAPGGLAVPRPESSPAFGAGRAPSYGGGGGASPGRSSGAAPGPAAAPARGGGEFVYQEVKAALADTAPGDLERMLGAPASATPEPAPVVHVRTDVLQVHSSFIVTQDEQGIVIIDQHALHERVMFEKLKARMTSGPFESQRLLMPATVPVDSAQMEALDALAPLLERLGIDAAPIGPHSVGVHAFTSLLFERGVDPVDFMGDLLSFGARTEGRLDEEAALHEVLDMMACKAAVKAGDSLEPREIAELLAMRETIERSSNCPHGRPTSLRLTLRDLERQFGRR